MAFKNFVGTLRDYPLAHVPTWVLVIGTVVFWLELYIIRLPYGHTSWLAWALLSGVVFCMVYLQRQKIAGSLTSLDYLWRMQGWVGRSVITIAAILGAVYLAIGFYASVLPPHLSQEHDALTYHITLARQHLIRHSFAHIPWSTPDFFLLPLDYALSPFWLSTLWPNKIIQFWFFIGSLGCVFHLTRILSGENMLRAWTAVAAVMASHAIAIQVGTAMLDLVMMYCFFAFLHSLFMGRWVLAAIEFGFFAWSKAFIAPQMVMISLILGVIIFLACKRGFSICEIPVFNTHQWKTGGSVFLISSVLIAAPYLVKSFYYTGTPLYPFGVGVLSPLAEHQPDYWQAILQRAQDCLAEKDKYGHGRSVSAFVKHWWLIAVPEKGVNNAFDYPVGMVYLLVLAPFMWHVVVTLKSKRLPVISAVILVWWLTWWFGSQQSRFLLVPICMMVVIAVASMPKLNRVFMMAVMMTLGLEVISLVNAHRADWGKPYFDVLRGKDKKLVLLNPESAGTLDVDFPDVAFASLPVNVNNDNSVYVIAHWSRQRGIK